MNATPEQIEAWKARKKAGATLQQQVHQQLVDQGMAQQRTIAVAPSERPAQTDRERLVVWRADDVKALETERPWQGSLEKKPWHYQVTAVIPHRNTPEHLELCIQFLQQQTERPYIMIIDTGSDDSTLTRVLALRSDSVEVHQVACHATQEYADVVCYAMDLAMSACRTEYLWCLHSDCFVINRRLLAELLAKADGGKNPVIGYESVSANKHPECQGMVSHTCTLLHVPTMDQLDICWSTRRLQQQMQSTGRETITDVEMALNHRLRDRGIAPLLLGPEQPNGIERDKNRVHLRSGTLPGHLFSDPSRARSDNASVLNELTAVVNRKNSAPSDSGQAAEKPSQFNLIYHVTPFSGNDVWRRNVSLLRRYMHVFNGRKIIAIAIGKDGAPIFPPTVVEDEFNGVDVEFVHVDNDPHGRESTSLPILLEKAFDPSPVVATFYAHTKGLSHPENRAVTMWYRSMYQYCLSDRDAVADALTRFACCGAFRKIGTEKHFPEYSQWHYSGTFFWFKNSRVYSHPCWRCVDQHRYGAEAYMSKLFRLEESHCLRHDDVGDLYDINYWNESIIPASYAESLQP